VNVPFRLRHRSAPAPVAAVWLASPDPRDLAGVCTRIGGTWPEAFALAGGFLVVTDDPPPTGLPRAVRLRRLAPNLYLPADADLVPALHPAEAADLTRSQGLVFLPDMVLAFDPGKPLAVADIVSPAAVRRDAWQPFPRRPARADRLRAIGYGGPTQPDAILEQGRPTGAKENAGDGAGEATGAEAGVVRPPDAPPLRRAAGRAAVGFGKFLTWLGRVLRRPGLAKAGANLIRRAVERVPRLTETILGRQEATLRELLRRFRAGEVESALRHAPPAVADGQPGRVDSGWTLGRRDPRYSLSALLGGGPESIWLGGGNVWGQLVAEYRRIGREAADRGDHRRAAYIYGVLLRDLRLAADTLAAGGLHRDAAVLYRDRVRDPRAAASAFERAGDFDEALRLYRQTDQYERAGDLLRRLGDEAAAIEMFVMAADRLARSSAWLAAGDLLCARVGRPDLGLTYYQSGWESPPPTSIPCGERLLEHHVTSDDWPAVWRLLDDAARRLAPPARPADAGRLYAAVARAADRQISEENSAELRDRARLALAVHLSIAGKHRRGAVSELFGRADVWPAAVVRDAAFAVHRNPRAAPLEPGPVGPPVQLLAGPVTAVVLARGSFDLVIGSATGEVVVWRDDNGQIERVTNQGGAVDSLATDGRARLVVTLHRVGDDGRLRSYYLHQHDRFQYAADREIQGLADDPTRLLPVIRPWYGDYHVDAIDGGELAHFRGIRLLPEARAGIPQFVHRPDTLIFPGPGGVWGWAGRMITISRPGTADPQARGNVLGWQPAVPDGSPLRTPPFDWLTAEQNVIELAGQTVDGEAYWSRVHAHEKKTGSDAIDVETACSFAPQPGNFRAVALLESRRLVAVTAANEVFWWRVVGGRFEPFASSQRLPFAARAVAVLSRPAAGSAVVVLEDGSAVLLPIPQ
jgi:tetratricopeptide (TPR) repeat protein